MLCTLGKKFLILRQFFSLIQKFLIYAQKMSVKDVNFASKNYHLCCPKF